MFLLKLQSVIFSKKDFIKPIRYSAVKITWWMISRIGKGWDDGRAGWGYPRCVWFLGGFSCAEVGLAQLCLHVSHVDVYSNHSGPSFWTLTMLLDNETLKFQHIMRKKATIFCRKLWGTFALSLQIFSKKVLQQLILWYCKTHKSLTNSFIKLTMLLKTVPSCWKHHYLNGLVKRSTC